MPRHESSYPADWLRIAEKDLIRVERCIRDADPEAAGFFLQQALEKFFKAFLLAHGWKLRRTHDLEVLLDEAKGFDPKLDQFRPACQRITNYYVVERYPLTLPTGLTEQEIRSTHSEVEGLIKKLRAAVP